MEHPEEQSKIASPEMLSFSARYLSRLAWSISMPLLILEVPVVTPRSTCSRVCSSPRAEVTAFTLMVEIPIREAGLRLEAISSRNTASSASTPRVCNPLPLVLGFRCFT